MDGRQNSLVDEDCTREPKRQKKSKTLGFMTWYSLPVRFHTSENPVHKCEFCQASKESRGNRVDDALCQWESCCGRSSNLSQMSCMLTRDASNGAPEFILLVRLL